MFFSGNPCDFFILGGNGKTESDGVEGDVGVVLRDLDVGKMGKGESCDIDKSGEEGFFRIGDGRGEVADRGGSGKGRLRLVTMFAGDALRELLALRREENIRLGCGRASALRLLVSLRHPDGVLPYIPVTTRLS